MKICKELFSDGRIVYWNYNINEDTPLEKQEFELSEDLIQIEYTKDNTVLDIGWYPEFDPNGRFIIVLIQDQKWESPIEKHTSKTIMELYNTICTIVGRNVQ